MYQACLTVRLEHTVQKDMLGAPVVQQAMFLELALRHVPSVLPAKTAPAQPKM
jgi:hypothetical protein